MTNCAMPLRVVAAKRKKEETNRAILHWETPTKGHTNFLPFVIPAKKGKTKGKFGDF
jgi:hypothetical protein